MLILGTVIGSTLLPLARTVTTVRTSTVSTTAQNSVLVPTTQVVTMAITDLVTTTVTSGVTCPNNFPNGIDPQDNQALGLRENSTGFICVKYYFYNASSTMTINTSSLLGINSYSAEINSTMVNYDFGLNFSVASYPSELTLGGPQNLNEGAQVVYVIHANSNSNGTYSLGLLATLYPSFLLCNGFMEVVVGNGSPDYLGQGSCTAALTNSYPLNSEGFVNNFLTAEVIGITNSS
jgi:hypothetical protein